MKKLFVLIVIFSCGTLTYGQNNLENLIKGSDWELVNNESYPYSNKGLEMHGYSISEDSILRLSYCYLDFDYRIVSINSDSLLLNPLRNDRFRDTLIFVKTICSGESNQFNNPKILQVGHPEYKVIINDSLGINANLFNRFNKHIILTEESQNGLNNFFLNNKYNDTQMEFFVCETSDGKFGVITKSEKVEIPPIFKTIHIDYNGIKTRGNKLYSVLITYTDFRETKTEHIYYY